MRSQRALSQKAAENEIHNEIEKMRQEALAELLQNAPANALNPVVGRYMAVLDAPPAEGGIDALNQAGLGFNVALSSLSADSWVAL